MNLKQKMRLAQLPKQEQLKVLLQLEQKMQNSQASTTPQPTDLMGKPEQ